MGDIYMEENTKELEIQLFSSSNDFELEQVCAILKENNIPFVEKIVGTGAYLNLSMGKTIQETTIFVSKDDYDKACGLISLFTNNNADTDLEDDLKNDSANRRYKLLSRCLAILFLGLPILVLILLFYLQ